MKCLQMDLSSPSLGNGPYQAVAGSQWSSVDSQLVMYVKPRHKVVDRAQSRQPWVILWDCLDFSHGKLDEGSSTGAEGSGYVTAFTGLCLDSMGLHKPEQTIQLKAVREKRKKRKRLIESYIASLLRCFPVQFALVKSWGGLELRGWRRADSTAFVLIERNVPHSAWFINAALLPNTVSESLVLTLDCDI